jgi:hypothetical protein
VPSGGDLVVCAGEWLLEADESESLWLYAVAGGEWRMMDAARHVERLGPVTLAWHNWQDGSPSVHLLRTSRELTGADREVALARYRRAQETWAEQTMDDIVRATEGTPAEVEPAAKDSTGPVEGATVDVIDGPLPRSDGGNAWSGGTAGTYLWPKFNRDEGDT